MVAILGNTVLTWVKEENMAVNLAMKQLLYHHWITHGVAVILTFLVLGFILSRIVRPSACRTLTPLLVVASAIGALGLVALFLILG